MIAEADEGRAEIIVIATGLALFRRLTRCLQWPRLAARGPLVLDWPLFHGTLLR